MEMRKCEICGEEYSTTYRSCPFCQESEAIRRGKPIRRHSSDFRNRRGGHAIGVLGLILALVVVGTGAVYLFGDNIAQALGIREADVATDDNNSLSTPIDGSDAVDSAGDLDPATQPENNDGTVTMPEGGDNATTGGDGSTGSETTGSATGTPPATAVTLSSNDFTLAASSGLQHTLKASGGSGTYTWSSKDPSVATVSDSGQVTGVGNGTTEVTGTDGYTTATCIVRIKGITSGSTTPSTSTALKLNREDMTMPAGTSFQLKVSGTSSAVTWSIADPSIATISSDGTVQFLKKGTTTATAAVDGQTLQCIVRVTN